MEKNNKNSKFLFRAAEFIVDRRKLFLLIFAILLAAAIVGTRFVKVENDVIAFLPDYCETRMGLDLMDKEFVTYGSCKVLLENVSCAEASQIADKLGELPYVSLVQFDESKNHYNNFSALIDVSFKYDEDEAICLEYVDKIGEELTGYDFSISTEMGDQISETLASEISRIIVYVAVIVVGVLLITCTSFAEIPVLLITFLVAAALAAGSNFLLGTISFLSNSVAIILQLALSVDYAVIFCNRYKEEHKTKDIRMAVITALSKAIPEIIASSLTTVGGLAAMLFMQFTIGPDLAIVLIKAIVISMLSVFLFMPWLLMTFAPLMEKTEHKSLVPKVPFVGRFAYATRYIMPVVFLVIIAIACKIQTGCPYVFGESLIETPLKNERQIVNEKIADNFGDTNILAMIIPSGSYENELSIIEELTAMDEVSSVVGLANTEARGGVTLTQKLNAREFAELLDLDKEVASVLYAGYAVNDANYTKLLTGISTYKVPFIDMFNFLYSEVHEGYLDLDPETTKELEEANASISVAMAQLQSEKYSRLLINLNLPDEGEKTFAFLDTAHNLGKKYYGDDATVYLVGDATSHFDLGSFFKRDNRVVTIISIVTVLIVLLLTFMSYGMPILLIMIIEGCIWINFAIPTITHSYIFFLSYLIVSSIQMGANIDYAIVVSSRYQEIKRLMSPKEAIIETMNFAFPTIITSGTMLVSAGLLIGNLTSMASISGVGLYLGQGTIISILAVLFMLPQILIIGDKLIEKTKLQPLSKDKAKEAESNEK